MVLLETFCSRSFPIATRAEIRVRYYVTFKIIAIYGEPVTILPVSGNEFSGAREVITDRRRKGHRRTISREKRWGDETAVSGWPRVKWLRSGGRQRARRARVGQAGVENGL